MLAPEIIQQLGQYAVQAKTNIITNHPQFAPVLEIAWQAIQPSLYSVVDNMFAQQGAYGYQQVSAEAIMKVFCGGLYDKCTELMSRQMYQPAYNQQQFVPNYLGGGMAMPPPVTNIYAGSEPVSSSPSVGTTMSPAVLNASNIAAKNVSTMMPQQQIRQTVTPMQQTTQQKPQFQTYDAVEETTSFDMQLTEEEKIIEELSMLQPKQCQEITELILPNGSDKINKVLFDIEERKIATLFTGDLVSRGFKSPESVYSYFMDSIIESIPEPMYANINYTKLIAIKSPNSEGLKCFKDIKAIVSDDITSVRDKLKKIKEIIDNTVKVTGDEIDMLITDLINKYTTNGYLDYDGEFNDVEFDNMVDIMRTLGTNKPSNRTALWGNKVIKDKLLVVVGMILNKLKNMTVYNYENVGDVSFIMDCIGSYTTDENITLKTIENLLLTRRSKNADKDALQSSPCYGMVKKYTVIGIPSTIIISNCDMEVMQCHCDDDAVRVIPMALDPASITTLFEYFLINFSVNTRAADIIIKYTPFVTIKYGMYVDDDIVRFTI